jgi:hypothetical protein
MLTFNLDIAHLLKTIPKHIAVAATDSKGGLRIPKLNQNQTNDFSFSFSKLLSNGIYERKCQNQSHVVESHG